MKLGSKIILGFVAICAIFAAIIGAVVISLQKVDQGSEDLKSMILPANIDAAVVQSSIARGGLNILDYGYSHAERALKKYGEYESAADSSLANLRRLAGQGLAQGKPKSLELLGEAELQFRAFREGARELSAQIASIVANRTSSISSFDALSKEVEGYRHNQELQILAAIGSNVGLEEITKRFNRFKSSVRLSDLTNDYYIELLRGLYYQKASFFAKAGEYIETILTETKALRESSSLEANRAQLDRILGLGQVAKAANDNLLTIMGKYLIDKDTRERTRTSAMDASGDLTKAFNDMTEEFTQDAKSSIKAAFMIMVFGGLVAMALSSLFGFFLTKSITGPINAVIDNLSEGATRVDRTSEELSLASNTLADGATENAASLEETSAALEELSSMTKRNADNAVEANSLMSSATEAVVKAENSMTNVIQAMDHIATSGN
ncbi:MAG: hypothetical protein LBE01_04255, partial [Deltaproteobacteria bacterium]|nr:hypothetical protein [Deltaproteobacteria bacterium]